MIFLIVSKDLMKLLDKYECLRVELNATEFRRRTLEFKTENDSYHFILYANKYSVMGLQCHSCEILDIDKFNLDEIYSCISRERLFE
jgi:hypothetical protein